MNSVLLRRYALISSLKINKSEQLSSVIIQYIHAQRYQHEYVLKDVLMYCVHLSQQSSNNSFLQQEKALHKNTAILYSVQKCIQYSNTSQLFKYYSVIKYTCSIIYMYSKTFFTKEKILNLTLHCMLFIRLKSVG